MNSIKKWLAMPFLNLMLRKNKNIIISSSSNVDYALLHNDGAGGSREYPVIVSGSQLGNIRMGEGCRFFDCVCRGKVSLGRFVTLAGPGVKITGSVHGIEIGSFTSIGANTVIQEGEHDYRRLTTYFVNRNILRNLEPEEVSKGAVVIHEGVWIGSNSAILSGVEIGRGAVIGAGSVVTHDVEPYSIYAGAPASKLKKRFSDEVIERAESTGWWKMSAEEIKHNAVLFHEYAFLDDADGEMK